MKHENRLRHAVRVEDWVEAAAARAQLAARIDRFVADAAQENAESGAALVLRVTAGLGKTATTLATIARHAQALLARGHVLIYMPTLDLAERAWSDFRGLAPDVPSRVIRGRDAMRPDLPDARMCARADLAKAIAGLVPSVTRALCRARAPDGRFVQSPCAAGCPYLAQKNVPGAQVVFLAHGYLSVRPPVDRDHPVALRVIDEKVWPALAHTAPVPVAEFMRAPPNGFPEKLRDLLARTKAAILDALQRDLPLHDHLTAAGIDAGMLQALADAESRSRSAPAIEPWQSDAVMKFHIETFDRRAFIASRRRQRIFERLSEREAGHCAGLHLAEAVTEGGSRQEIRLSRLGEIDRGAPLLLLDADADPDISERIAPGAAFVSIQSPPQAEIVQISDLTLSNSWLLHPAAGKARRAAVLAIIAREVARAAGGGVLIVATKPVLRALHGDLGHVVVEGDDRALQHSLLGAQPRWFGPRMQGVNDFEDHAAIVVVGRLQPGIDDVEQAARAVFARDAQPIATHASGPLPAVSARVSMADGSTTEAIMRAHPDPRAQAILAQSRECATLQAIARLRLVSPRRGKRVVILSNLPLPGLPITRRTTLAALGHGMEHEPDWQGFLRLSDALREAVARGVRGIRLSAAGLAADLPASFATEGSACRFRRGRTTADVLALCQRIASANGWQMTPLLLRSPAGGKPVPAILFGADPLPACAARLWHGLLPERA